MLTYLARRVLIALPTLLGVATVIFFLVRQLPGDPARVLAGVLATPEEVENIRHQFGLDGAVWLQYLRFIGNLLVGNLGLSSRTGQPVINEIAIRAPYTGLLAITSISLAGLAGVAVGVLAATHHNTRLDVVFSGASVFGVSMPVYWLGMMLILVFSLSLHLLPAGDAQDPLGIVMPTLTLAAFSSGFIARQTRSAMLEVLGQDYVRTARAKGAARRAVLIRHALRNALLPIITTVGLQFGTLLGGAVLTETVFSWPGVGRLLVDSIFSRDYAVVQGVVFLLAVAFMIVNLLTDVLYAYVDPRIRYN